MPSMGKVRLPERRPVRGGRIDLRTKGELRRYRLDQRSSRYSSPMKAGG